jgi:MFS family permease
MTEARVSYRDELYRELTTVGITGRLRARITDEIHDHLQCAPEADLGDPQLIARRFADELGTARARRAGLTSFAALAVAGVLFAVAFASSPPPAFGALPSGIGWAARLGNWTSVIAPQVAFAAGLLALLRALRRRHAPVMPRAEARMLLRRATVGVVAGLASMIGLSLVANELAPYLPSWWVTLVWVCAALGVVALLASVPALIAARRLPSLSEGPAGDLFDDIGAWVPRGLEGRPWRLALVVASAIFILMSAAGWMASDGYDGMIRGLADGLLCLLGFATLGRYLGLWAPQAD